MDGIRFFEQPAVDGWVYPCSLDEIREVLSLVPPGDLDGLRAAGLAPSTRKDCNANGRYFRQRKTIALYPYPESLTYRYGRNAKEGRLRDWCWRELEFGMKLERDGARWRAVWIAEDLRQFILWHVLLHELGHHVYFQSRSKWHEHTRSWQVEEQFAEDYAERIRALIRPVGSG